MKRLFAFWVTILFSFQISAQTTLFSEDWSSGSLTTNGWTFFPNQIANWKDSTAYIPTGASSPCALFFWAPQISNNYTYSIVSPIIQSSSYNNLTLSYRIHYEKFIGSIPNPTQEEFKVEYKSVGSSTWTTLITYDNNNSTSANYNFSVNNQALIGVTGNIQIRFRVIGINTVNIQGWTVDDIVLKGTLLPACTGTPTVSITANTYNYCDTASSNPIITATPSSSASGFIYQWQTRPACSNTTFTDINGATFANYIVPAITSANDYRVKITCIGSNQSAYSGFINIYPACYCQSGAQNSTGADIGYLYVNNSAGIFSNPSTVPTQFVNNTSANSVYSDYSYTTPIQLIPGNFPSYYVTQINSTSTQTSAYLKVYIDLNRDGDFTDLGEQVNSGSSSAAGTPSGPISFSGTLSIPSTTSLGYTKMRLVLIEGAISTTVNPCANNYTKGETEDYTVLIRPTSSQSVSATNSGTACLSTASTLQLYATPTAGMGCSVFAWTGPNGFTSSEQNPLINNPTSSNLGTYSVNVTTYGNVYSVNNSTTVYQIAAPVINQVNTTNPTACGLNNGSISLTGLTANTAYTVNYTYNSNPVSISITSNISGVIIISNLGPGTYDNFNVSISGCFSSNVGPFTLSSLPFPSASISYIGDTTFCTGSSLLLTANTGTGLTYKWKKNGSLISGATNNTYTANTTGSYTVMVTNSSNCSTTSTATTITVNSLPSVSGGANKSVCSGQSVTLSGSGTATSFVWNNGISNSVPFVPTQTTTYTVTGIDANGCSNTANVNVAVNPYPVSQQIIGNPSIQPFQPYIYIVNSTAGIAYNWIPQNGAIQSGQGTNSVNIIWANNGPYSIKLVQTNASNCSDTAYLYVSNQNCTAYASVIGSTTFCSGGSVELTSPTGVSLSYQWKMNGNNISGATNNAYTAYTTGSYSVAVIDNSNNCAATSSSIIVTAHPLPNVNAGNNQSVCTGGVVTLNATGALSYLWSNGITNAQSFTPLSTNTYSVSGTDGNGCTNTAQVTVSVNPLPTINAGNDMSICWGNAVTLNAFSSDSITWSNNIINNQPFTPLANATYIATATNAFGCTKSDTIVVSLQSYPTAFASTTNTAICPNGNTTLTASGGATYLWSNGDTSAITTVNQPGNYYVIAMNQYGCTDTSNDITITQKTLPTQVKIKAVGATSVCEPGTVAFILDMPLGSTTGFGYQWYLSGSPIVGATDSFYNANTTGSYALSVYGGDNCSKFSYTKPATIKPAPNASFAATSATTICSGGFVTLVAPTISGCTYTWLKDGVSAGVGSTKLFKVSGNYTVIAKINGCSDTASPTIPIVVNPLPIASVTALNTTTFCAGDSCTIAASPIGAVSYEWHNGNFILDTTTTEQYTIGITATIKVLVKDANGCIGKLSTTNVKTKANVIPLASISSSGSTTISSTGSVKLKATPSSGVTWQWFKDGNAISNATANSYIANTGGTYTVAITKLGCTGTSSGVVVTQTTPKENAVTNIDGSFEMSAYPNPVSEVLTVTISGLETIDGIIQVMDMSGKLITSKACHPEPVEGSSNTGFDKLSLTTENWSSGVYLIRYKDDEGRTGTVKVVKE